MIKLFKIIKQKPISVNKLTKYLLYALGEILLIAIGILIALKVNNNNEYIKNRKLEKQYYKLLLEDIKEDENQIEDLIQISNQKLDYANRLAVHLQSSKIVIDSVAFWHRMIMSGARNVFEPNHSAFDDLKGGANLNLITDLEIKNKIKKYYTKTNHYKEAIRLNAAYDFKRFQTFAAEPIQFGLVYIFNHSEVMKKYYDPKVIHHLRTIKPKTLSKDYIKKYYDEAIILIGMSVRRIQLNQLIKNEIIALKSALEKKCKKNIF